MYLILITRTVLELKGQTVSEAQKVDVTGLWGDTGQFQSWDCKSGALSTIVKDRQVQKARLRAQGSS